MKIILPSRWTISKADEEAFKQSVSEIAQAAAAKRLELKRIMLTNPFLPFTTTWLQNPQTCCWFSIYCLFYVPIVGLIAVILDLLICSHCHRYGDQEQAWIINQLDDHPELDCPAINTAIAQSMLALAVSMSSCLSASSSGSGVKVVYWCGQSRLEFSSGPAVTAEEYQLQLWSIPSPNASPLSPTTHKFISDYHTQHGNGGSGGNNNDLV